MRKITFVVGFTSGFLLGSRAGHGPYDQVEAKVREFLGRPETQAKIDHAKDSVVKKVEDAVPFLDSEGKPTVVLHPPSSS
jgi:hypothetical protein